MSLPAEAWPGREVERTDLWDWLAFGLAVFFVLIYSQAWIAPLFGVKIDAGASGAIRNVYFPAYAAGIGLMAMVPGAAFQAMLRAEAPVYEIPDTPGLYFVTTWPYVREALMDPGLFSNLLPHARRTEPPAEIADQLAEIRSKGYPYTPALGNNDAPEHTRYRKLVNRSFTVRSLAWMEPLVDEVANQIAGRLVDGETIDAVENITVPLPVWAIMRILGIEDKYRDDLRRWSDSAASSRPSAGSRSRTTSSSSRP